MDKPAPCSHPDPDRTAVHLGRGDVAVACSECWQPLVVHLWGGTRREPTDADVQRMPARPVRVFR
jgi:hypothetical protein